MYKKHRVVNSTDRSWIPYMGVVYAQLWTTEPFCACFVPVKGTASHAHRAHATARHDLTSLKPEGLETSDGSLWVYAFLLFLLL